MRINGLSFSHKITTIFVFCLTLILLSAADAGAQESEIESLISEVSVDTQKNAIMNYTYLMKFSYNRHRFGGRKFTRLYEAVLPSRYSLNQTLSHPLILLEDSERSISAQDILRTREHIARRLEKFDNDEIKEETDNAKSADDGGYWTMSFSNRDLRVKVDVLELLRKCFLKNLKRIAGTNLLSIEFSPKPSSVFEKSLSYLSRMEGQIFIDETSKRIIRIEGFAPGTFAALKEKNESERQKEAVFLFVQTKVAEGYWFPQTVWLNFSRNPEIFEPVEVQFSFGNYQKGSVDVQYTVETQKNTGSILR